MKLRTILLVLCLLAFLSASIGGSLYYSALKEAAITEAERKDVSRLAMIRKNLSFHLNENVKPVRALAGMEALLQKLTRPADPTAQDNANAILDLFKSSLNAEVCYLMDYEGDTVASSNRNAPDSFVGKNFAFRPYFRQAFHSAPATYLALGVTSGKRGAYFSYPVFEKGEDIPIGLAVIKAPIDRIESQLGLSNDEIVMVVDPLGVVFISNRKDWLFQTLTPLTIDEISQVAVSKQFGSGPFAWTGLEFSGKSVIDHAGNKYLVHRTDLDQYPGWEIIHLRSLKAIADTVAAPFIRISGPMVISICMLIGLAVFFLYRRASHEILQRRSVEKALRESDKRYRSLYHNTPAMLHSIDSKGRLLSVSDYWLEALGYQRDDVIGRKLTDFFSEESREYAENKIFPEFFQNGFCKDVPYRFVKNSGEPIDILLSAIAVRNDSGEIVRSLAVSIDVTERKRAEEALKQAKEKLSRYSRDLERQVDERTREISSILKYTPDIVSIKDNKGRYVLINTRYEEILGMRNDDVKGKTDAQILPGGVARQLRRNDELVFSQNRSCQVEEFLPHADGVHTYLTVKFPIYDETDAISGVCGISTDITALKKAQNQLRRLSAGMIESQEKERAAIARELHDELGQVLTALRIDAAWMVERFRHLDPKASRHALTMCNLIDKNINDVRGMSIRLRPGVLDDLGLVDALEWYTSDFEKRTGITCVFQHRDIGGVDNQTATAAYRITQEALTNVVRHADASRVDVTLAATNDQLQLMVSDDGNGFNTGELSDASGLGVAGMRERAVLVGGKLSIQSGIGKGTRVLFQVLPEHPDTEAA